MKKVPLVSIVILNWNGKEFTKRCLESIRKNTDYPNYEVIVVDQGSKDGSIELLEAEFPEIRLLKNSQNVGFSAGNNLGFKNSNGKYVYMLNNDTEVMKGWLTNIVSAMENDEKIAAAGSVQINPEDFKKGNFIFEDSIEDVETAGGAAMIIRKEAIDRIGELDAAHFSPIYGEENDWCYRASNAGYRIIQVKNSLVVHVGEATNIKEFSRQNSFVLRETNRIKAMLFNLPFRRLIRFFPGLGLIFARSVVSGNVHLILKSYWNILTDLRYIMKIRKSRLGRAKG